MSDKKKGTMSKEDQAYLRQYRNDMMRIVLGEETGIVVSALFTPKGKVVRPVINTKGGSIEQVTDVLAHAVEGVIVAFERRGVEKPQKKVFARLAKTLVAIRTQRKKQKDKDTK